MSSSLDGYNDVRATQRRDKFKEITCNNDGITLVVIPYWWDQRIESLAHTLHVMRPDVSLPLMLLRGDAIPTQVPQQQKCIVEILTLPSTLHSLYLPYPSK